MEDEAEKWFDKHCWTNKGRLYRYFALLNITFLGLGSFVCFDTVGAMQEALMTTFDINFSQFSLLYSVVAWPNIAFSLFGGILIDRLFGIKVGTLVYCAIFVTGHMIFSLGVLLSTFWCALFGRFINGLGSEFLYICLQIYTIQYFKGKELSMVMCINISVSRLGSSIVYAVAGPLLTDISHILPSHQYVGVSSFIVGSFTLLTVIGASVLSCMSPKPSDTDHHTNNKKPRSKISWRSFLVFPVEFWLILCVQTSFCVSIYVFLPYTQEFFKTMYGMSVESANSVTSFFSIIGAVMAPFVGMLIDKLGRGLIFSKIGLVAALLAHLILAFTSWTPYFSLLILSLAYALFNGSILPMFAFIIAPSRLGTAYGVTLAVMNASYASTISLAGLIVDEYGYIGLELFMIGFVLFGMLASGALWIKDMRGSGILNMTPLQRKLLLDKLEYSPDVKEPLHTKKEQN